MAEALLTLRLMFPDASTEALQAVLQVSGSDVHAATEYLLSDEGGQPSPTAEGGEEAQENSGGEAEAEGDGGEGSEEEEEAEEEEEEPLPAKRLKTVEPSPEANFVGKKANLVLFDSRMLKKTYLELLNLPLSKLVHTSVTMWSDDVTETEAALGMLDAGMLDAGRAGWWVQYFPIAEIDHVWRLLVSAHLTSKLFGKVVHVTATSFRTDSGGDFEVRLLVSDVDEVTDLKRIGAGLLSVAPSSTARDFIFFLRVPLKPGQRESKTRLEEKSIFKLSKERRKEAEKVPGRPFQFTDPDRLIYRLYKVEPSTPTKWVLVEGQ
ncbi:hypothetical protein AB1Y20_013484 [Prymnesium parvum]|uniref:CUE domain-containing protein n=1 Tax=Prymnesium parvum TaxID=97485 RepID=A0AB34IFP9_PRYPA